MSATRQETVPVTANERLNERFCRLRLAFPELAAHARPGQFVTVAAPGVDAPLLRRPFSIHRVRPDGSVELLIKIVGRGTRHLAELAPGHALNVLGPLGNGVFAPSPERPELLLVAGGIGIAPFLFLAETLRGDPRWRPQLLFGGGSRLDLAAHDEFAALGVPARLTTEDGSLGRKGLVTDELRAALDERDPGACQTLACGPTPMLRAVAELCAARGVPCRVSLENLMACGVGSCRGCVVPVKRDATGHAAPYARVCREGPVCDATDIAWERLP